MGIKLKNDKYRKSRGGTSKLLDLSCSNCNTHIFLYQKDGPGALKRLYLDRIYESAVYSNLENESLKNIPNLVCTECKELIGVPSIYKKENRLAYKLVPGKISKSLQKKKY